MSLGWSARWEAQLASLPNPLAPSEQVGRVVRRERRAVRVAPLAEPDGSVLSVLPEALGHATTGDWVVFDGGSVVDVLPRASALTRRGSDGSTQLLAANVEIVLILSGADRPLRRTRLERGAAMAYDVPAKPVVVISKGDAEGADQMVGVVRRELPFVDVLQVSAQTGQGIPELVSVVEGMTAVVIGESGAGKSTLTSTLSGRDLPTANVRSRDAKGRHATAWRELVPLPGGGAVIDTPGLRTMLLDASSDAVDETFEDVSLFAASCRFHDCSHGSEPDCAIRAAVADGQLTQERVDSWKKLLREVARPTVEHRVTKAAARRQARNYKAAKRGGRIRRR